MREFLRSYTAKPWPKLEIPAMGRTQVIILILYTAALIGGGWYIYLLHPRAVNFYFLGAAIPLLFILKSPYFTIVSLLAFEVVMAFLFIGNNNFVIVTIAAFVIGIISFEIPFVIYLFLILMVWFGG